MLFCRGKCAREQTILEMEQSLIDKERSIRDLYSKDDEHSQKLRRHDDMLHSLNECVSVMKKTNQELKEYHDKNSGYFQAIIDNMITVNVFTRNIKWLAGVIIAVGAIWKGLELFT